MKVLFDRGTPLPLRGHLPEHSVDTAAEKGWSDVDNGALIDRAEQARSRCGGGAFHLRVRRRRPAVGYEVLVTTDQNMRHQQNLGNRRTGAGRPPFHCVAAHSTAHRGDSRGHRRDTVRENHWVRARRARGETTLCRSTHGTSARGASRSDGGVDRGWTYPAGRPSMTTDTSERGLERLICTALAGHPCTGASSSSAR